jgi:hypothetical protein
MIKAIKIQRGSKTFMEENYPKLYEKGLTMFPIFIYNSDGPNVMHLSTVSENGIIRFIQDTTNEKILNTKFKRITSALNEQVRLGSYVPSDNIRDELQVALGAISEEITLRIKYIYNPNRINTYFGTAVDYEYDYRDNYDEEEDDYSGDNYMGDNYFGETGYNDNEDNDEDMEDNDEDVATELDTTEVPSGETMFGRKQKPSEMSIEELEQRMIDQYPPEFSRKFKPEKYTNSLGYINVRYVKRTDCPECPACPEYKPNVFTEFGTGSSEEELLFE